MTVSVEPLPAPLPADLQELNLLRQQVRDRQAQQLAALGVAQQDLHRALRSCGAAVHCRLDLLAQEALQRADAQGEAWLAYHLQLSQLELAVSSQLQREQTGRLV